MLEFYILLIIIMMFLITMPGLSATKSSSKLKRLKFTSCTYSYIFDRIKQTIYKNWVRKCYIELHFSHSNRKQSDSERRIIFLRLKSLNMSLKILDITIDSQSPIKRRETTFQWLPMASNGFYCSDSLQYRVE